MSTVWVVSWRERHNYGEDVLLDIAVSEEAGKRIAEQWWIEKTGATPQWIQGSRSWWVKNDEHTVFVTPWEVQP